ncbi:hypoxanthine phosphoribosyltransferase, partial [Dysosmobacter welbionis]
SREGWRPGGGRRTGRSPGSGPRPRRRPAPAGSRPCRPAAHTGLPAGKRTRLSVCSRRAATSFCRPTSIIRDCGPDFFNISKNFLTRWCASHCSCHAGKIQGWAQALCKARWTLRKKLTSGGGMGMLKGRSENGGMERMMRGELLVAVVDGQGGGMGRGLVEAVKKKWPSLHVRALGTNSLATAAM